MPFTTPGTAVAGDVLTAAFWNSNVRDNMLFLPRGVLGLATTTSYFTTSATHTTFQDVTGLSFSATYQANRYLRATLKTAPIPNGGLQPINFRVVRGSTTVATWAVAAAALDSTYANNMTFSVVFQGPASSATETFKIQMNAASGNTQVGAYADATYFGSFAIEDIGSV
jgi:hypothetical protein